MTKKIAIYLFLVGFSILSYQCSNTNKFKISKGKVGSITATTTIQELQTIFKNDSIVANLSEGSLGDNYFQDDDEYLVYEKGGKHLLTIIPKEQLDSTSTIKSVEIFDPRFTTTSGLNLNTTFAEINTNNVINKVETSLSSATLFIDEFNATVSLDKEDIGIKQLGLQKISLEQIPDLTKIQSFIIWFN